MAADQKISELTSYATPLNADLMPIVDTANTTTKYVTWANIKATLKTYFDTLYGTVTSVSSANAHLTVATGTTTPVLTLVSAPLVTVVDDTTTNATMYPAWFTTNTGVLPPKVSTTKMSFNPSTAILNLAGGIAINAVTVLNSSRDLLNIGTITSGLINGQTITNSASFTGTLTVTGALLSAANDGSALGASGTGWSDLFLASGAVINFDAGNITLTHSAGVLTLGGGTLALGTNSLTMTGSIAATGARVTKGWFTDLESTNMPTVGGTAILSSLTAPQFTTIELGHASDTTISRSAAGVLAVEGVVVPTISSTNTLTNKRTQPRVYTVASNTSLTPELDTYDIFHVTALAGAITINNPSTTTPADGELMEIRLLDNGTARAISFGTAYVAKAGVALPTTTVLSKNLTMLFEYNANLSKWNLLASGQEA